eukprot:m.18370 g.18370  ORF g.18370 m.18370 type:complete len:243 (+) comp6296_c0_seq2:64-792(+)
MFAALVLVGLATASPVQIPAQLSQPVFKVVFSCNLGYNSKTCPYLVKFGTRDPPDQASCDAFEAKFNAFVRKEAAKQNKTGFDAMVCEVVAGSGAKFMDAPAPDTTSCKVAAEVLNNLVKEYNNTFGQGDFVCQYIEGRYQLYSSGGVTSCDVFTAKLNSWDFIKNQLEVYDCESGQCVMSTTGRGLSKEQCEDICVDNSLYVCEKDPAGRQACVVDKNVPQKGLPLAQCQLGCPPTFLAEN